MELHERIKRLAEKNEVPITKVIEIAIASTIACRR